MNDLQKHAVRLPPEQEAIRAKCVHPSGIFIEFPMEDVEKSIPERFEKIVLRYPERIAVKTKERQLNYKELNERANRLAHYLLAQRGAVQEPVALFLDQWDRLLIAHLAVLKAGKFSLGLDPAADKARTAHLLADSGARDFSGDLGCISQDGCLQLLGRKDFQVKIRSFRVDVAEVEAALKSHSDLNSVAVIGVDDEAGHTKLVAYIVSHLIPRPSVHALRTFLKRKLPHYMIPSTFVFLDALPVMSTGKINRRALPDPGNQRPDLGFPVVSPQTRVEKKLASIWEEVLSLTQVGIHDDFFDLGGHSLSASRVVSRVIQAFQLELPVKALFDSPTIAEMAAVITKNQARLADESDLARMLREVEVLSDEEARAVFRNLKGATN